MSERMLDREIAAVRVLKAALIEQGCDEDAMDISIASETNLHEAIAAVLEKITESEMMVSGIGEMVKRLGERKARLDARIERQRLAIERGMAAGELHKVELPEATISLRRVAPGLHIVAESLIPANYFTPQPPKLDKTALKDALKGGVEVPGAALDNGGQSITIRRA